MAKQKGTKLIYTFKSDVLFKMLFTRNPDLLKRLVSVLFKYSACKYPRVLFDKHRNATRGNWNKILSAGYKYDS